MTNSRFWRRMRWWLLGILVVLAGFYFGPKSLAYARWSAIGRPMSQFEVTSLQPRVANQSSRDLTQDLFPMGLGDMGQRIIPAERTSPKVLFEQETFAILTMKREPADKVSLKEIATPLLDQHSQEHDALYRRILSREPPVWDFNPQKDPETVSYLAFRKFAQFCMCDAVRRISLGDMEGAHRAVEAALRVSECLQKEPSNHGWGVRNSIESLMAHARVWLPLSISNSQAPSPEVPREQFRIALQTNAWQLMEWARPVQNPPSSPSEIARYLTTLRKGTYTTVPRWNGSTIARAHANFVEMTLEGSLLRQQDLGRTRFDALYKSHPEEMNPYRMWLRLNGSFLLSEQVRLIQETRTRLSGGDAEFEVPCASITGAVWRVNLDAAEARVTLELDPLPNWAVDPAIFGNGFYLVRPDGSESWHYNNSQISAEETPTR